MTETPQPSSPVDKAKAVAEDALGKAKDAAGPTVEKAVATAEDALAKAKDVAGGLVDKVKGLKP